MMLALQQLLRIEPGEGRKVAQFATLALLLQAGLSFGSAAADSLFLVNVGADKLPHIYLIMPAIMMFYIPAYSYLLGRWGIARVFDLTLGILVAGGIGLWALFTQAGDTSPIWLCYMAKLYSSLWYVGTYSLFWNFIDSYFDLRDAKRLFALFAAGSAVGAIVGGSLVGPLSSAYGVSPLFLLWSVSAGLCWPLGIWTRRTTVAYDTEEDDRDDGVGASKSMRAVGHLFRSPYAVILTLLLFATLVTATLCEFQYLGVFASGLDEAELAGLLGRLTAIVNVLNLGITLFFFNRLVARFGVPNVAFIQPIAYTLVFTWLLLDRGFLSAAGGFIAYQGIMTAIDYNNVNLLFSGLPAENRKQIRTFIEGIGEPLATATAGVFLFFIGGNLDPADLSIGGALAALTCLALVFALRSRYSGAIAANLKREWLDFSRATFTPSTSIAALTASPTHLTQEVAAALVEIRSDRASAQLLPELLDHHHPSVRRVALEATHHIDTASLQTEDALLPALLRLLPTASLEERIHILDTIDRIGDSSSIRNLLQIAHIFQPSERRRLVRLILNFGPRTVPHLTTVAQSPAFSVNARCIALNIIGKLAPAQADGLAKELTISTLKRAYLFLGSYLALSREHPTDSGQVVLTHIYRDFPNLAVEVVLETLSVTGRLAGPEATLAALRSGTAKERSYAIEAIEQSCDRSVFNLLLPLIDGRSLEAQIEHGTRTGLLPHLTPQQVLEQAAEPDFPLQASAVAQANYHCRGPSADALLETLRACPQAMVHRTVMALLTPPPAPPPITPVDVAQSIMNAAPLKGALFIHHETLVEQVEVIEPTHDQVLFDAGTPSDGLWHIMSGSVSLSDSAILAGPNTTLGQEEFHAGRPHRRRATALAGSRIVHLTQSALEHTVRIHPTFGMVLLRQKFHP